MAKSSSPNPPGPDAEPPIVAFDGAITTHLLPAHHPNRTLAFSFKVTFNLSHPRLIALSARKPPLHFHPYQKSTSRSSKADLGLILRGWERGSLKRGIRPWVYHRLFPVWDPGEGDGDGDGDGDGAGGDDGEGQGKGKRCVFLLSGQDSGEPFRLDTMFFQNWYGYQDEVVMRGGGMDLIQVMHDYRGASSKIDAQLYKDVHAFWRAQALAAHNATGANMTFTLQPIPANLVDQGNAKGGNPLGLPRINHQWWTTLVDWDNAKDDETVRAAVIATSDKWKELGEQRGSYVPFLFMNDGSREQSPLSLYGSANIAKLKAVSRKYDSSQLFQNLQNGGFLLSTVDYGK